MIFTDFQIKMNKERRKVVKKFQRKYKTTSKKEEAFKKMENKDIEFLIYCSNNIYANIFYSKHLNRQ